MSVQNDTSIRASNVHLPAAPLPAAAQQRPTAVIFLGMDGVLIGDRARAPVGAQTRAKVVELFGKIQTNSLVVCESFEYEDIQWKTAFSHCLSGKALDNLHNLIERVSKVMNVVIVISSPWREAGTVAELKEKVFGNHAFSKYIVDKTPHDKVLDEPNGLHRDAKRGEQVEYWLKMNSIKFNVQSHVAIDYLDDRHFKNIPNSYVQTTKDSLLTKEHVEQAFAKLTRPVSA